MGANRGFWSVLLSFWAALIFSIIYAALSFLVLWWIVGEDMAAEALRFFVLDYGGLITGTGCATLWFMSFLVLRFVPDLIEEAIPDSEIEGTDYAFWKRRFDSDFHGLAQFATYFIGGYAIYSLLNFPVPDGAQIVFTLFTALQFAFGGFVGRKIWCVGHMLRSLEDVSPREWLFDSDAFPRLIYLVNIFTFLVLLLTVVHTYVHSRIDYVASSEFSVLAQSLVYLPLVLAFPVLVLFNFYPRMVINRLYLKSIRLRKDSLAEKLIELDEPEMSKLKHKIDYEKYLNEEFRYRQKVALSELPVALTIVVAVLLTTVRVMAN